MQKDFLDSYRSTLWQEKKNKILTRDNYTCAICGKHGDEHTLMHVHHLTYKNCKNHHAWDCPDEDLVTLCEDCHAKVHSGEPYKSTSKNYKYYKELSSLTKFRNATFYFVADEEGTIGLYTIDIGRYDEYGNFFFNENCRFAIFKDNCIHILTKSTEDFSHYHYINEISGTFSMVLGFICKDMADNVIYLNKNNRPLLGCLLQIAMFEDGIKNWEEDGDVQVNYDYIIKAVSTLIGDEWMYQYRHLDECYRADIMSKAYHLYSFIISKEYTLPF